MTDADPLSLGGYRGQKTLRRRTVGIALQEVMLNGPHMVEAQFIGEAALF